MPAQLHGLLADFPLRWLRDHAPERLAEPATPASPVVARDEQRRLLEAVAEEGGEATLLDLTRGLVGAVDEPLIYALLNVASVAALVDKEQRLNRFFHSHHRVRVLQSGSDRLELEHTSDDGARPARVESLFVLGLHLVMLEEVGCAGLWARLSASGDPDRPVYRDALVRPPLPDGPAHRWLLGWSRFVARRAWAPGLDDILERASEAADLGGPVAASALVRQVVGRDLVHRWSAAEVAAAVGRSRRTLQRELSGEGTTLSRVIEDARLTEAERLLRLPDRSITEIGYTCGFADTAHFSRRFKARRGQSPSVWRRATACTSDP